MNKEKINAQLKEVKTENNVLTENNTNTRFVNYTTRLIKLIPSKKSLNELLEAIDTIDFLLAYYQDTEMEEFILSLRDELTSSKDYNRKIEIKETLKRLEPKIETKEAIIIDNLLVISEKKGISLGTINNLPYYFNNYYWELVTEDFMKDYLSKVAEKSGIKHFQATKNKIKEDLYKQFISTSKTPTSENRSSKVMINMLNGTFIYEENKYEFRKFHSEDMLTYQLPFEYNPKAKAPVFLQYLNEVMPEKEAQFVMSEYIGYIFAKHLKLEKCLVLVGSGANGKSVFGDIVYALLGKKNVTSFSLGNLCDKSGYYRAEIGHYLLSYSSEMGGKNCDPDLVKQLISNESVSARSPYGKPITVTNYCRFMFNANILPKDIEQSYGYFRRFMFLMFDVTIPEEKRNPNLAKTIIETELSGVFNWVLEGLDRLITKKTFTSSPKIETAFAKVKRESNSVALFVDEHGYKSSQSEFQDSKTFYSNYSDYCKETGYHSVSKIEFLRRLEQLDIYVERGATNNTTRVHCSNREKKEAKNHRDTMDLVAKLANVSSEKK